MKKLQQIGMRMMQAFGEGPHYETVPLKYDEIRVACVQMNPKPVSLENPSEGINANIEHMCYMIDMANTWPPRPGGVQLIAFPEFAINGMDTSWSRKKIIDTVISLPGPETERLGEKAKEHDCYICFANYSTDPEWPGHIFNMSVIIGPDGTIIHKHMKAAQGFTGSFEWATTVHDILDEFVERHGWDAVWPVAKTPIGNIGTYVCSEGFLPETARALTMNGAEILIRSTANNAGEPFNGEYAYLGNPALAARVDSGSNHVFGIFANSTGSSIKFEGMPFPENGQGGHSMIIDQYGFVMSQTGDSREEIIYATLPIASHRKKHELPMLRKELYAPMYENCFSPIPPNLLSEHLPKDHLEALDWSLKHKKPD